MTNGICVVGSMGVGVSPVEESICRLCVCEVLSIAKELSSIYTSMVIVIVQSGSLENCR